MPEALERFGWLTIPATIITGDVLVRFGGGLPANLSQSPSNLLASVGLSLLLWWACARLVGASQRRWVWAVIVAMPAAFLTAATWIFHSVSGTDPTGLAVAYLLEEPGSALQMALSQLDALRATGIVALGGLWAAALAAYRAEPTSAMKRNWWLALVPFFFAAVFWPAGMTVGQTPFTADFHTIQALVHGAEQAATGQADSPLGVAERAELDRREARGPNVIVVIAESLRRDRMQLYGHERATTPNISQFFAAHPHETYRFDQAVTASAYTQLSVPMITSGLYMARSRQTMHHAPLLWQYARAAGAQTFLVSPQQWSWQGLNEFMLLDQPPDEVTTAEDLPGDIVNDVGVHDKLATRRLVDLLEHDLAADKPFVGVVQTNATHFPFLPKDDVGWKLEDVRDAYDAAVALTDDMFGQMVDALAKTHRLDDTVIIFVADHAEFFYDVDVHDKEQIKQTWQDGLRVRSCHPVVARIPMFVYLPQKWAAKRGVDTSTLRANEQRRTSTIDIVPTVLDLWQIADLPETADLDHLDGQSLLEPIAAERTTFCINSAGWNLRPGSGFAAYGPHRAIYGRNDFERFHVYDLDDPAAWTTRGPGARPTPADSRWLEAQIAAHPLMRRYLQHAAPPAR